MTNNLLLFEENYKPEEELEEELEEDYELEYDDIVTSVINSLKCRDIDYCYKRKDMTAILNEAKKQKLSLYYQEYLEKDGTLDYFKIVPARFYTYNDNNRVLLKGQCYNVKDIPNELYCEVTRAGGPRVIKHFYEPVNLSKINHIN